MSASKYICNINCMNFFYIYSPIGYSRKKINAQTGTWSTTRQTTWENTKTTAYIINIVFESEMLFCKELI